MKKRVYIFISIVAIVSFILIYIYVRFSKVKVLNMSGQLEPLTTYQIRKGLTGTKISQFFDLKESVFVKNLFEYDALVVCEPLQMVLDEYRRLKGSPVIVTSYNRDRNKQLELVAQNPTAGEFSTHEKKMAADVYISSLNPTAEANRMIQAGKNVGIPIRVGVNHYVRESIPIIHVDVAPYYYACINPIIKDSTIK